MNKSDYFHRTVAFAKRGDSVTLVDLNNPKKEIPPLDQWLGLVVSLADGQHTLQQLIEYVKGHYKGHAPHSLEATIDSAMTRLIESEVVKLSDDPIDLPYYLTLSADKLDLDLAKQLLHDDYFHFIEGAAQAE